MLAPGGVRCAYANKRERAARGDALPTVYVAKARCVKGGLSAAPRGRVP